MFSSKTIKESGLTPLNSKDIPNYFRITKTVIRHHNVGADCKMVCTEVNHFDSNNGNKTLNDISKAKKFLNYIK